MDFGKILDSDYAWKNFTDKDSMKERSRRQRADPAAIKIDDEIDLHGLTVSEARAALDVFFDEALREGLRKVLIIHGKGNHSKNGPVLAQWLKEYLDSCRRAGKTGQADKRHGGSGATWVMVRSEKG